MTDDRKPKSDLVRRSAELGRTVGVDERADPDQDASALEASGTMAFSLVSADRQHKAMVEFRFLTGNTKALAYAYLAALDYDPSEGITMDFGGYEVHLRGRNLRPLFDGLVAQRVAWVQEMDDFQSQVHQAESATVVTRIEVKSWDRSEDALDSSSRREG
jgi:hypothetical protein